MSATKDRKITGYLSPYCELADEDPTRFEQFHHLCPGDGTEQRTVHGYVVQVYRCAHSCHTAKEN